MLRRLLVARFDLEVVGKGALRFASAFASASTVRRRVTVLGATSLGSSSDLRRPTSPASSCRGAWTDRAIHVRCARARQF